MRRDLRQQEERPQRAAMAKCIPRNACLPFIMRLFLVLEVIVGVLFIVFALVLQTPPKAAVPMCVASHASLPWSRQPA